MMPPIEAIFYRGPGNAMDTAIRLWTRSPYSHCELHFGSGHCFGADAEHGVGWRLRQLENNPDWVAIALPHVEPGRQAIMRFCAAEAGCAYDWKGIFFSEVFPFGWESPSKWFCSEILTAALQLGGELLGQRPCRISPGRAYDLLRMPLP